MPATRATVAFAACRAFPDLWEDDRLILAPLAARGVRVVPAVWDDPAIDWGSFDAVIVRETWDYHLKLEAFEAWIGRLRACGARAFNPPDVLERNIRKSYLRDLEARGVPIVPTRWLAPGADAGALAAALDALEWPDAVVKPEVSANAFGTVRVRRGEGARHAGALAEVGARVPLISPPCAHSRAEAGCAGFAQPFVGAVETEGEWSFLFFDGAFSHAVLKRPKSGDFRVQLSHGGTTEAVAAPPGPLVAQARAVLDAAGLPLLYARVDMIRENGGERLLLSELEATEPLLFLGYDAAAPERFAEAIARRIG